MKRLLYTLLYICAFFVLLACESKHETAGDLAGMWQLTEWRNANDSTIATKEDGIYYCVQLNLMRFVMASNTTRYHLSYYRHTQDSLSIYHVLDYPADTLVRENDFSMMHKYGVPADGKFHIDVLNNNVMQLSSKEGTLVFRKY